MSLLSILTSMDSLRRELERLNKDLAREKKKEADNLGEINRIQKSIANTSKISPSTLLQKNKKIASCNAAIASASKQQAQLTAKISKVQNSLNDKQNEYQKELGRQQKQRDRQQQVMAAEQSKIIERQQSVIESLKHDVPAVAVEGPPKEYDFFISHASEDKGEIATPLYEALIARGARVWYDDAEIRIGSSIRKSIDVGISMSKYGIIILSPSFIKKYWTEKEFNAFFSKDSNSMGSTILPIWHNITMDEVQRYSSMVSDIKAFNSAILTVDVMAESFMALLPVGTESE